MHYYDKFKSNNSIEQIKLYHWQNPSVACGLSDPMFYNSSQCQPFRNTP